MANGVCYFIFNLLVMSCVCFILTILVRFPQQQKIKIEPKRYRNRNIYKIYGNRSMYEIYGNRSIFKIYGNNFGRTGNHLWIYASVLGIAKSTGREACIPPKNEVFQLFTNLSACKSAPPDGTVTKHEKGSCKYTPTFKELPDTDVFLCCYLHSFKYFEGHEDELRKEFTFTEKLKTNAEGKLREAAKNSNISGDIVFVGVHIRRGDMISPILQRKGFVTASKSYIQKAMDYFQRKMSNVLFIVCSNDIQWARRAIVSTNVAFMDKKRTAAEDLAILSHCNHTIITVGTFGWWGAWLAGGDVVYYKNWPRPGTVLHSYVTHDDYFLPHWVALGD